MVAFYPTIKTAEQALAGVQGLPLGIVPLGRIFWVDGTTELAKDSPAFGYGEIATPFATIAYACSRCVDGRGDVIIVKRNHYEVIEVSTNWVGVGISIIGEGRPGLSAVDSSDPLESGGRPQIEFKTNDAARVVLTGAGSMIHGIDFMSSQGAAAGTQVIVHLDATGQILSGCRIFPSASGADILVPVYVDATDCILINNLITQKICSGAQEDVIRLVSADRTRIVRNRLIAQSSNEVFEFTTAAPKDVLIAHNRIEQHNGSVNILDLAGATGMFAFNGIYHADSGTSIHDLLGTGIASLPGLGSLACIGNYMMNANGESGGIVPATVST